MRIQQLRTHFHPPRKSPSMGSGFTTSHSNTPRPPEESCVSSRSCAPDAIIPAPLPLQHQLNKSNSKIPDRQTTPQTHPTIVFSIQ
jgi:hypothetical protein